jgi:Ni/Co efflux regulator RcnB
MTKTLLALLASAFLTTAALAADQPKKEEEKAPAKVEEKAPAKKEEKAPAKKEEVKKEKACIDKMKDGKPVLGKDGKPEQVCKEVKVHEKLDGHKVPDKK